MDKDVERMLRFAKMTLAHENVFAPFVELHFADGRVAGLVIPDLGSKHERAKSIAILGLKAMLKALDITSLMITSEGWLRAGKTFEAAKASERVECLQIALIRRDGTGAQWIGLIKRMPDEEVYDISEHSYVEGAPSGGSYSALFDGDVPDALIEKAKEMFRERDPNLLRH